MTEIQNSKQVLGIFIPKPNERTLPMGTTSVLVIGY